jgi:phenylacetate-CoA ligase
VNLYDKTYSSLARNLFFPLHERAKRHHTFQMIREMEEEQWLASGEFHEIQEQRLQVLLRHAFRNSKYYRAVLQQSGLSPGHFQNISDLSNFPFLTKSIIRTQLEDLRSTDGSRVQKFTTGGSTGSPVAFYLGSRRVSSDVAARWRAERWWGVGIGDREYVIWGSPLELTRQDRVRSIRDRVLRTKLMSAFEMDAATMDRYLDEMLRTGCVRVFGYPSSIFLLCQHARRRGKDLSECGVRAVFVTAEYLWDHWRKAISEAFNCPVANGYGGRDSGFIAHECPSRGMHITADRIIVEIIGEDNRPLPPGEVGEIVVTHLDTPEMAFIRYRTGDMGALSTKPCSCGRTLPLLERIEGRRSDFIVAADGRLMHGLSLIYVLRKMNGIEEFRIVQKTINNFEVQLVINDYFSREMEDEIRREFRERLRSSVEVEIRYLASIPPLKSGKLRYVISEVGEGRTDPTEVDEQDISVGALTS